MIGWYNHERLHRARATCVRWITIAAIRRHHGTAASEARHSQARKRGEPTSAATDPAALNVTDANLQDPERCCLTQNQKLPLSVKQFTVAHQSAVRDGELMKIPQYQI